MMLNILLCLFGIVFPTVERSTDLRIEESVKIRYDVIKEFLKDDTLYSIEFKQIEEASKRFYLLNELFEQRHTELDENLNKNQHSITNISDVRNLVKNLMDSLNNIFWEMKCIINFSEEKDINNTLELAKERHLKIYRRYLCYMPECFHGNEP